MSRGARPLSPGAEQAQKWWMVPVREAPLRGRLRQVRDAMDRRVVQLREEDPDKLHSTHEEGSPSVLALFPDVLDLFGKKPDAWFERSFGVSPRIQSPYFPTPEWEGRILRPADADVVHFAEVYGLGLLAGLDVYVGNGYSFLRYLETTVVTKKVGESFDPQRLRDIFPYPHTQAARNQGAFRHSSAPLMAIDFSPQKPKEGKWNIPFFEAYDYEQIEFYSLNLLQQISKQGSFPPLDFRAQDLWPVFFSPAVRRHLDIALFGEYQLIPIDTLGLLSPALTTAMQAKGFYPRRHLQQLIQNDGRLTSSLGCCFHDETKRLISSDQRRDRA